MPEPMRVAIVEDDRRYRESLATLTRHTRDLALAGCYSSAEEILREIQPAAGEEAPWDLVLMDLDLPGLNGIEATRRLKAAGAGARVVILTVFEEPATILGAICAGADGYLLKKSSAAELLEQLRVIGAGGAPLTPAVARSVLDLLRRERPRDAGEIPDAAEGRLRLTAREREVLGGLVRGLAYKQVASDLSISIDTVRYHIRAIYTKLQVHSVAAAVTKAIREGLV